MPYTCLVTRGTREPTWAFRLRAEFVKTCVSWTRPGQETLIFRKH